MAINVKTIWKLIGETFTRWNDDKAPRLGAALSYYTLFSLAPILIIVISLAGIIFGREAVQGQLIHQLSGLVGQTSAEMIQEIVRNSSKPAASVVATIVGIATLLVGATGVLVELQDALNTIWGVKPKPGRGIMGMLKDRLLSFALILGVGFLLLVSLVISAGLAALSNFLHGLPGITALWSALSFVISFGVITVLFMMIYKVLPDVKIAWSDVWVGAAVTSLLFTLGKFLIGLYLGQSGFSSTYGAAGSIVILLVWVYYSSQLIFFGAEFTQVYANYFGTRVVPDNNAIPAVVACADDQAKQDPANVDLAERKGSIVAQKEKAEKKFERDVVGATDKEDAKDEKGSDDGADDERPRSSKDDGATKNASKEIASNDERSEDDPSREEHLKEPVAKQAQEEQEQEEEQGSGRRSERAPDRDAVPPMRIPPGTFAQRIAAGDGLSAAERSPATEPRDGSLTPPPPVEEVIVIEIRPKDQGKG